MEGFADFENLRYLIKTAHAAVNSSANSRPVLRLRLRQWWSTMETAARRVSASAWLTVSWVHLGKLCLLSSTRGKNACDPVLKQRADGSRFPWNAKRERRFSHGWRCSWQADTRGTAGFRRRRLTVVWIFRMMICSCVSACHLSNTSEHKTNRQPKEKKVSLVTEFQVKSATSTSL